MSKKTDLLNLLRRASGTQYELAKMLGGNWNHHAVRALICELRKDNHIILNKVIEGSNQTRYHLLEEKVVKVNNKMKKTLYRMPRGSAAVIVSSSK
jgi:hypothetical protein